MIAGDVRQSLPRMIRHDFSENICLDPETFYFHSGTMV
ncbi:hypothetical protein BN3590_03277 [Clostridium sp. C105KSO15]|nr:hypothetical protein BN3590_03277 [Clostridium sp. C105KSO15]